MPTKTAKGQAIQLATCEEVLLLFYFDLGYLVFQ